MGSSSSAGGADRIWGEYGYDKLYGDSRTMSGYARGGADKLYGAYDDDSLFGDAHTMTGLPWAALISCMAGTMTTGFMATPMI